MKVSDVFESSPHGTIIVGINPSFDDLTIPEIQEIIGDCIIVANQNNELKLKVISIQISTSLANKKNIGICVGKRVNVDEIQIGSIVYTGYFKKN